MANGVNILTRHLIPNLSLLPVKRTLLEATGVCTWPVTFHSARYTNVTDRQTALQ